MNIFTINQKEGTLRCFANVRDARNSGNTNLLWASPTELNKLVKEKKVDGDGMLRAYNSVATKPVASFASNAAAVEALFDIAKAMKPEKGVGGAASEASGDGKEASGDGKTAKDKKGAKPAPAAKKAPAKKDAKAPGGKAGQFTGKRIFPVGKENTRRAGTKRHAAQQIILDAGKTGILYEDYVKKGGGAFDLLFLVEHEGATVK